MISRFLSLKRAKSIVFRTGMAEMVKNAAARAGLFLRPQRLFFVILIAVGVVRLQAFGLVDIVLDCIGA